MDKVITIARDNLQKYCFIRDISGKEVSGAASFFSYRGRLFELHNALIHVRAMGDQTMEQVCDNLRREIVNAMRAGQVICIDCGKIKVNFGGEMALLPWDDIFNFVRFREEDVYNQIVKPDERYLIGMQNQGQFMMREQFSIVVISDAEDENYQEVLQGIWPWLGKNFYRFNVTRTANALDQD